MAFGLAVVAVMNVGGARSVLDRLTWWDSTYYAHIATNGYPDRIVIDNGVLVEGGRFAFSPLYPALTALLRLFGVPTRAALLGIALASAVVLSVLVHLLGRRVVGTRRAGYIACAAIGVLPMSIALQTGYAEGLALALSAAALLFVLDRKWWIAGACAALATLTRPTAVVVVLAIPVAAWTIRKTTAVQWREVIGATCVGFAAAPAFWIFVWLRTGHPAGWFEVQQAGWRTHFDFGVSTARYVWRGLHANDLVIFGAALTVLASIVVAVAVARRPDAHVFALVTVAAIALALGSSNPLASRPRILLAAFPVLVIAARPLSRLPSTRLVTYLVAGVTVSTLFGAYALTLYPYAA